MMEGQNMKFKELFNEDWTLNWDIIEKIPQFDKLKATQQSTVWHKEGNVYFHTVLVVQEMKHILFVNNVIEGSDDWIMCMMAALCHDLGKAETTKWSDEKNDWTTKNHGIVGERITRNLFKDEDIVLREKVCYMVRHHMTLHHVFDDGKDSHTILKKLSHGIVAIRFMLFLKNADSKGSLNDIETTDNINAINCRICEEASALGCLDKPYSYINKSQLIRDFIGYSGEVINETNDFCVYILVGFPGCGKSTYIKNFLSNVKVLSRDIIRGELGIGGATVDNDKKVVGTWNEEEEVSKIFDKRLIECCEKKESCVLDNINLKSRYRKDYLTMIMKYSPKVKIIYVEAPDYIETCKTRREGQIPINAYFHMEDKFDFPQLYECDELVLYKQFVDKEDETCVFKGIVTPKEVDLHTQILNDLIVTRGAMILDGYDCYDSCIKFMDELIEKYDGLV